MTPIARVEIVFGTGVGFGDSLVMGDPENGLLGTNVLGDFEIVEITEEVYQVDIERGRDDVFGVFNAGAAFIEFYDRSGDWNPQNQNSPYFGRISPTRQVRIWANHLGTNYRLFTGWVKEYEWQYEPGQDFARVNIECVDSFRIFNLAEIDTVPGAQLGDSTGDRITQILDLLGWPSALRDIDGGEESVRADSGTLRKSLDVMQTLAEAELGSFYVDPDNAVVFRDRTATATANTLADPLEFGDQAGAVPFNLLELRLNDAELYNDVRIVAIEEDD